MYERTSGEENCFWQKDKRARGEEKEGEERRGERTTRTLDQTESFTINFKHGERETESTNPHPIVIKTRLINQASELGWIMLLSLQLLAAHVVNFKKSQPAASAALLHRRTRHKYSCFPCSTTATDKQQQHQQQPYT